MVVNNKTAIGTLSSIFTVTNGVVGIVASTTSVPGSMSAADKTKLDGITAGAKIAGDTGATDNAVLRADGTGGATLQNSLVVIDDNGSINIPTGQAYKVNGVALAASNVGAPAVVGTTVDNAVVRFDGVAGAQQTSLVTIDDNGSINIPTGQSYKINGSAVTVFQMIQRSLEGSTEVTDMMYWVAPVACTIVGASMHLLSAPSGATTYCRVQVMKNGNAAANSIFTDDTAMVIANGATASNGIFSANGTLDSGQVSLAAGDVLRFAITEAATGSADLLVQVRVKYL